MNGENEYDSADHLGMYDQLQHDNAGGSRIDDELVEEDWFERHGLGVVYDLYVLPKYKALFARTQHVEEEHPVSGERKARAPSSRVLKRQVKQAAAYQPDQNNDVTTTAPILDKMFTVHNGPVPSICQDTFGLGSTAENRYLPKPKQKK
jgi:hypothetical protein